MGQILVAFSEYLNFTISFDLLSVPIFDSLSKKVDTY